MITRHEKEHPMCPICSKVVHERITTNIGKSSWGREYTFPARRVGFVLNRLMGITSNVCPTSVKYPLQLSDARPLRSGSEVREYVNSLLADTSIEWIMMRDVQL